MLARFIGDIWYGIDRVKDALIWPFYSAKYTKLGYIETYGFGFLKRNIVTRTAAKTPEQAEAQLRRIMTLPAPGARKPYTFLDILTGMTPFFSINNEKGASVRQHKYVAYFNPKKIYQESQQEVGKLFSALKKNNTSAVKKTIETIVTHHLLAFVSRMYMGEEMNETERETLLAIEHSKIIPFCGLLPNFIIKLLPYLPSIHAEILNYDAAIKSYLRRAIANPHTWVADAIAEKYPDKRVTELSEAEIEQLILDPDMRIGIGIVLAVNNLSMTMSTMIKNFIYDTENIKEFLPRLLAEINVAGKQSYPEQSALIDSAKMPLLHALYLETLRHSMRQMGILRYSSSEINEDGLAIPANSTISYNMSGVMRYFQHKQYLPYEFAPQRFLTEDGKIREDAQLNHGALTPFGLGPRMCPGRHLAEIICKNYMIAFAMNVQSVNASNVVFNSESSAKLSDINLFKPKQLDPVLPSGAQFNHESISQSL